MKHIFSKAQEQQLDKTLEEVLDYLEQLKDSENWKELLQEKLESMKAENDAAQQKVYEKNAWDFSKEKTLSVFVRDTDMVLRPFRESDKSFYYTVRKQWEQVVFCDMLSENNNILWENTQSESSFFCIVEWQEQPVGYVGICDTRESIWEVSVEFDKEYCFKGLGGRAIRLFLKAIEEATLKNLFYARVEVDNLACQKCMEKIGANLAGICNGALQTEEERRAFEEENQERIDKHIIQLADQLGVEPRLLLTHVLKYEIEV